MENLIKVIFLDFSGTLVTAHGNSKEDMERRVKILSYLCKKFGCKTVVSSAAKEAINEQTLEIDSDQEWIKFIFELFKKYEIDCIGRTPTVERQISSCSYYPIWKEDEIILFLKRNLNIISYCVLDDDDMKNTFHKQISDLDKVRNHLVTMIMYSENPEEEGLLEKYEGQIARALQEENEVRQLVLRRQKKKE